MECILVHYKITDICIFTVLFFNEQKFMIKKIFIQTKQEKAEGTWVSATPDLCN